MEYYHVRITQESSPTNDETRLDLSFDELKDRFLNPYRMGSSVVIQGKSIPVDDISRIRITKSDQDSNYYRPIVEEERGRRSVIVGGLSIDWEIAQKGEDVTDELITGPPGLARETMPFTSREPRPSVEAREVFVVHGRNGLARDALFQFLRAIDLHPLEWTEAVRSTGKPSPYIGEILDAAFSRAHAVVVLFTPDDEARLRQEFRVHGDPPHETNLAGQARPNVLFEAGMAMSRTEERTILVEIGVLRPFSDVAGRHVIRFDGSTPRRQELAQRLEMAGCPVNWSGTDWHSAGDFDAVIESIVSEGPAGTERANKESDFSLKTTLTEEALFILVEATKDKNCLVQVASTPTGKLLQTNGRQYGRSGDRRIDAKHIRAFDDLVAMELISDNSGEGKYFGVTEKGFEMVDSNPEALL